MVGLAEQHARHVAALPRDFVRRARRLPCDAIEREGAPYMHRFFQRGGPKITPSERFHLIVASDPDDLHDHPWDFVTTILRGCYLETTERGEHLHEEGSTLVRPAESLHRLTLPDGPVWTFVTTGKVRRPWGFQTRRGWVPWREYSGG